MLSRLWRSAESSHGCENCCNTITDKNAVNCPNPVKNGWLSRRRVLEHLGTNNQRRARGLRHSCRNLKKGISMKKNIPLIGYVCGLNSRIMHIIYWELQRKTQPAKCIYPIYRIPERNNNTRYSAMRAKNVESWEEIWYNAVYGGDKYEKFQCANRHGASCSNC